MLLTSCSSKSQNNEGSIAELKKAFAKNDEALFLKNFPKDYPQFVSYFGWNETLDTPYPLYEESTEYIDKFFQIITKENNIESLNHIINIGIEGKYQADAVNYFKMKTEEIFTKNPDIICELLKNRKNNDIDSYWHFYLDSPQPLTNVPSYLNKIKNNCNSIYKSLEKQLTIIQKENLVSEITHENKANKLRNIKDFIPNGYMILDSVSGDFNADKIKDKMIVLADQQEFKNNESRLFLILLRDKNGEYNLKIKNPNVIPCIRCAGGSGGEDSYKDLLFQKDILSFIQLKIDGSNLIETKYEFQNKNNEILLSKVIITKSDLSDENIKTKKNIDNLNLNIKDFNYNNYQNNFKTVFKINDPDGYTNLRSGKSTSATILQTIKSGSIIEVSNNTGDWWQIITTDGKKGYVHKSKIKSE